MDPKELRGLIEAYSEVYAPEQLDEQGYTPGRSKAADAQVAKNQAALGNTLLYGNSQGRTPSKPTAQQQMRQKIQANRPSATKPAAPAAKPAPTPAAKPAPAKPAPTPAAKPAAPAAKPAASTPAAKVAPTAAAKPAPGSTTSKPITSQPAVSKSQSSAAEIRGMIGRSMERQAASTPTAAKLAPTPTNKATGSKKPGSIVSGFDLFDIVRGYLLDEGYAETLEEAEWMMANLIDEEAVAIILEASCEDDEDEKEMKKGKKSKKEDEDDGDEDDEELDEALTGERYKKAVKKPGGTAYSRMVSADPKKRATRGGRGGESDFGAGDRGSGNKAARRAGTYQEAFESWLDEAMTNYEKNRKRAAQRAAARNAARDQGKTGAVPGVGYVTPRRERETWTDESGKTRHAKGL